MRSKRMSIYSAALLLTATALCPPASAAITLDFTPGASAPSAGFTVINTFDNTTGITGSGYQIKTPPADPNGAPPADSNQSSYLSVLAGGMATIMFAAPVSAFQFDWGSVDSYNTLTILGATNKTVIPGITFPDPADGNQVSPTTNGLFTVTGTAGELFNGITLGTTRNSFEIDNLAVGSVVEPATWALMIGGLALVGVAIRRRKFSNAIRFA